MTKDAQALGATIKSVDEEIVIARVLHGSLAHKSGRYMCVCMSAVYMSAVCMPACLLSACLLFACLLSACLHICCLHVCCLHVCCLHVCMSAVCISAVCMSAVCMSAYLLFACLLSACLLSACCMCMSTQATSDSCILFEGQLSPGDVLISINGHPVAKRSLDDVADEMQLLKGMITLQVIRKSPSSIRTLEQNKVRDDL